MQRPAVLIKTDVHTANGLSCADCHGGDPANDDPGVAMSKAKGFVGKPAARRFRSCAQVPQRPELHAAIPPAATRRPVRTL